MGEIMRDTQIEPGSLRLEINVCHLMEDSKAAIMTMNRQCALVIKFSIDDFGTGYSSFGQSYFYSKSVDALQAYKLITNDFPEKRWRPKPSI